MWEQSDRPVFHSTNELHCIQPMPSNNTIKSQMINLSLIILPLFINSVQKNLKYQIWSSPDFRDFTFWRVEEGHSFTIVGDRHQEPD